MKLKRTIIINSAFTVLTFIFITGCAGSNTSVYKYQSPEAADQAEDSKAIVQILESIHHGILNNDLSIILNHVNKEKGIFIDLKAQKTYSELNAQIKDQESYLNTFFLNTDKLKETTNSPDQISIKDILKAQKVINIELFFNKTNDECEVKLNLKKKKNLNYRLNNPYFIKVKNKWYIYRLM